MSNRYDRDHIRREHIREEQRREERNRTEASQKQRREIEGGFLRLNVAGRQTKRSDRLLADNSEHQLIRNILSCEAAIARLLDKLKTLPDESDDGLVLFFFGSNAEIRSKAHEWNKLFSNIRLTPKTEYRVTIKKIRAFLTEVNNHCYPPASKAGVSIFKSRISDSARPLLHELASKLRWLDQYHVELDDAKLNRDLGFG